MDVITSSHHYTMMLCPASWPGSWMSPFWSWSTGVTDALLPAWVCGYLLNELLHLRYLFKFTPAPHTGLGFLPLKWWMRMLAAAQWFQTSSTHNAKLSSYCLTPSSNRNPYSQPLPCGAHGGKWPTFLRDLWWTIPKHKGVANQKDLHLSILYKVEIVIIY